MVYDFISDHNLNIEIMEKKLRETLEGRSCVVKLERLSTQVLRKHKNQLINIKRRSFRVLGNAEDNKRSFSPNIYEQKSPKQISMCSSAPVKPQYSRSRLNHPTFKKRSLIDAEKSEYIVEDIRSVFLYGGAVRFEVKWKYWEERYNTIEPLKNLNCAIILKAFVEVESVKYQSEIEALVNELTADPMFNNEALKEMFAIKDISYNDIELKCFLLALINSPKQKKSPNVVNRIQKLLQRKVFIEKRQSQLAALSEWESKMNEVDFKGKLRVINNVDLEGPPLHFTYIDKNIPVSGVIVSNDPPLACSCDPCSYKSNCCGKMHGSEYAYSERRLKHTGIYLFECNKKCKCGPECTNRVVQKGRTNKLCIFKTSNGCGWGVKTDRHIRAGDFVCEYMGEIIKSDDAEQRGQLYDQMGVTYLFDLDHIIKNSEAYTIDAYRFGNVSHFINHSCEPNLCVVNVWIDCLDPNLSRLALFALEDIEKGQEITIDYKFSSNISIDENVISANDLYSQEFQNSLEDFFHSYEYSNNSCEKDNMLHAIDIGSSNTNPIESARTPESKFMLCKCAAKKCRKILRYC